MMCAFLHLNGLFGEGSHIVQRNRVMNGWNIWRSSVLFCFGRTSGFVYVDFNYFEVTSKVCSVILPLYVLDCNAGLVGRQKVLAVIFFLVSFHFMAIFLCTVACEDGDNNNLRALLYIYIYIKIYVMDYIMSYDVLSFVSLKRSQLFYLIFSSI